LTSPPAPLLQGEGSNTKFGFYTPFFRNPPNLVETFRWNVSRTRYKEKGKGVYKSGFGIRKKSLLNRQFIGAIGCAIALFSISTEKKF